ncbi:MAG: FemAB family PEP-CTERM system-associated protein [Sphingomonadales bacterium]|nr:FemAB family PEP-CTERM system-associated protein [Sphingomonadales bacterium]
MNAPFRIDTAVQACTVRPHAVRLAALDDAGEAARIEAFLADHPQATPFHRPVWLAAVAQGTGNRALALVAETGGQLSGYLPLSEIHSPIFGRLLASTGFAVGGGVLTTAPGAAPALFAAAEELALRHSCPAVELRGGELPDRKGWTVKTESHCGFVRELAADDEAQLTTIPRKQRAEVRKGLANPLEIAIGSGEADRAAHYAVYAESVRNLGTPVFPRALFDAVLDRFGGDADILTVRHEGTPVASVLSLYHRGAVMPYWGGGTWDARRLRANDRMYFELMLHARRKGCTHFDFGRSKTRSGAYDFKRNWGFEPEPLSYAAWTAPGCEVRDADPTSAKHKLQIAVWQKLPLRVANTLGPWIARGLG